MKKYLEKILLFVIVFLIGISGVNAAQTRFEIGMTFAKKEGSIDPLGGGRDACSDKYATTCGTSFYTFKFSGGGDEYAAFCLDPQRPSTDNYEIDGILGERSNEADTLAYDAAVYSIIENGQGNYDNIQTAIRLLTLGTFSWAGADNVEYPYDGSRYVSKAIEYYASEKKYSEIVDKINGTSCANKSDRVNCYKDHFKSKYSWYYRDKNHNYGSSEKSIRNLFLKALEEINKSYNGQSKMPSLKVTIGNSEVISSDENQITSYMYVTLNANNFKADGKEKIKNLKIDCPNCSGKGISIDQNSLEYCDAAHANCKKIESNTNLTDLIEAENNFKTGKIVVRFIYSKTPECKSSGNVNLSYDYYASNFKYRLAISHGGPDKENGVQRFIIAQSVSDPINGKTAIPITCNANDFCGSTIKEPLCDDKATGSVTAPKNIKTCVLNGVDDAGNSYNLTSQNGGLGENGYCSVFCKEDYNEIRLTPKTANQNVVCGGYFQLTGHIKGKKDCYTGSSTTNKAIDKAKFVNDVKNAQADLISAYNTLKALESASVVSSTGTTICGESYNTASITGNFTGVRGGSYDSNGGINGVSTATMSANNFVGIPSEYQGADLSTKENGVCKNDSKDANTAGLQNYIASQKETVKNNIKSLNEKLNSIISSYNACTVGWKNDFKFIDQKQELKFSYKEFTSTSNLDEFNASYSDLINKAEKNYMETTVGNTEYEMQVCLGQTNEKYECLGESITITKDYNNLKLEEIPGAYKVSNYFVVDGSDYKTESKEISSATFVRKTVSSEKNYKNPEVFLQVGIHGKIALKEGFASDAISSAAIKNNGLPITNKAVMGGIFAMDIQKIGEFYDDGSMGRIFNYGVPNARLSVAAAKKSQNPNAFDGEFKCTFETDCRDKCPDCTFECDPKVEKCELDTCPNCNFECINCLFNNGKLQANFKSISTTNVESANRAYGYNWITKSKLEGLSSSAKNKLQFTAEKADKTIEDIEKENTQIYDSNSSSLSLSVNLTNAMINRLKEINRESENAGGYANDTLKCYDAKVGNNTYGNVTCYSEVLDELLDSYGDKIVVSENRPAENSRENITCQKSQDGNYYECANGYWKLWDKDAKFASGSVIGGPSWR